MKVHSTNYFNTFIEAAEDCPVLEGTAPPEREPKTAARVQYELLKDHPYQYTSDDILYESGSKRRGVSREDFFAKGQPCFRASALTKRYGWGVHSDKDGRIAIYGIESEDYKRLATDGAIKHIRAMATGKK